MPASIEPSLDDAQAQVTDLVHKGRTVWLYGPIGSGRRTLAHRLAAKPGGTLLDVELLPLRHADAVPSAVIQLAAAFGAEVKNAVLDLLSKGQLEGAGLCIGEAAIRASKTLVLRVPASWSSDWSPEEGEVFFQRRASSFVAGLSKAAGPTVWIADAPNPGRLPISPVEVVALQVHGWAAQDVRAELFGAYAGAATQLVDAWRSPSRPSPLAWRLAVGAVALGERVTRALTSLVEQRSVAIRQLVSLLMRRVAERGFLRNVAAVAATRRAVNRDLLAKISRLPAEHIPLITECIAYGGSEVVLSSLVSSALREYFFRNEPNINVEDAHSELAQFHAAADGARSLRAIDTSRKVEAWIEKVHHLAHAGAAGSVEWTKQDLPAPEWYWDRGRYLSMVKRAYVEAAEVYMAATRAFPGDDYSWHYLGYNLEKAKAEPARALEAYAKAVSLSKASTWWNSRLVTFLIDQRRWPDACAEWRRALARVDPDGSVAAENPYVVQHFHYWVAKAWLRNTQQLECLKVTDGVPERFQNIQLAGRQDAVTDLNEEAMAGIKKERVLFEEFLAERTTSTADHVLWGQAQTLWTDIAERYPRLPAPAAFHDGEEDVAVLAWSLPDWYCEVRTPRQGSNAWFCKQRTGTFDDAGQFAALPSEEFLAALESLLHG